MSWRRSPVIIHIGASTPPASRLRELRDEGLRKTLSTEERMDFWIALSS